MKTLLMAFLFFSATASVFALENPTITASIKCLNVDMSDRVVGDKSIILSKTSLTSEYSEWSIEEFIGGKHVHTSAVNKQDNGFSFSDSIVDGKFNIEDESVENFLSPNQMEPFFARYSYRSTFFNTSRSYRLKCLHLIF